MIFQRHVVPLIPQVTDTLAFQQKLWGFLIMSKMSYLREHFFCGPAQTATFNSMPEPASDDAEPLNHARVAVLQSSADYGPAPCSVILSTPAREEKISTILLAA
jgi:hypothetical protein